MSTHQDNSDSDIYAALALIAVIILWMILSSSF